MKNSISDKSRHEAMKVAKATQKAGQTKEQTKLIAQGIEKGIAEYKKQQKLKARERDKARKQQLKLKLSTDVQQVDDDASVTTHPQPKLPWILLGLSWMGFLSYYLVSGI